MKTITYTASTVCAVAGVNAATLRSWRNRTDANGRALLEMQKGDRRRELVAHVKQVEGGADEAAWDDAWDRLEQRAEGWTRYTFRDLLSACALAELARVGVVLSESRNLRRVLARQMERIAAKPPVGPLYVLEDQTAIHEDLTLDQLCYRIGVNADHDTTFMFVVDAAKLLRRILQTLRELGQPIPESAS